MTRAEYARHRGVTLSAVLKAERTGRIRIVGDDVNAEQADKEWAQNTGRPRGIRKKREPAANGNGIMPPPVIPNIPSLAQSNAVRVAWMSRLAKLEFERRAGELINKDEVKRQHFAAARRARDLLLALADRITPLVVGMTSQPEIHAVIMDEVHRALDELSRAERTDN